jgi:hypothetical protein
MRLSAGRPPSGLPRQTSTDPILVANPAALYGARL